MPFVELSFLIIIDCSTFCVHTYILAPNLVELKSSGLEELSISVDAYHLEYVNLNCLQNILRANRKVGIALQIALGDVKDDTRAYEIIKKIDVDIYETKLVIYPFLPVGRGSVMQPKSTEYRSYDSTWTCPSGGEFMITPKGDTYPCCSQAVYGSILSKGNVFEKPLADILKSYQHFCYYSLLRSKGFQWFYDILTTKENMRLSGQYVSPCHLCYTIFTKEEMYSKLTSHYDNALIYQVKDLLNL